MADYNRESLDATVAHFADNSTVKNNGVREIPKKVFYDELEKQGVTKEEVTKVTSAMNHLNNAGARLALQDLETKIEGASADDLKNDEHRRGLSATVRLPTPDGSTNITSYAEKVSNIPFRPDADGNGERQTKTTYGRLEMKIDTKRHIHTDFATEADQRIRSKLGVK